jgi:hypothetical protein
MLPLVDLSVGGVYGHVIVSYVVQVEGTSMTLPSEDAIATIYRWHLDLPDDLKPELREELSDKLRGSLQIDLKRTFGSPMITPWFRYDKRPLDCMWQSLRRGGPTTLTREQRMQLDEVFPARWWVGKNAETGPDGYSVLFHAKWRFR